MKAGCQGVSIAMPYDQVRSLDRLRSGNRTTHVNNAVRTYLEVQSLPSVNSHGVDCDYLRKRLGRLMIDMDRMDGDDLCNEFGKLAHAAYTGDAIHETV